MQSLKENGQMISFHSDSIIEIIEGKCNSKSTENKRRYLEYMEGERGNTWHGPTCKSAKEIIQKCLLGDHDLYEKYLKPKIKELNVKGEHSTSEQIIKKVKRKRRLGDQGNEIDIHKVYQGQIDKAWSSMERIEVSNKIHLVTLMIDYSGNSGIDATDSLWRAAVVVKIYEELELAGKSVQIVVGSATYSSSSSHSKIFTESIFIKKYNQSLSLERLAAVSHVGCFRILGFLGILSQNDEARDSLGRSVCISDKNMPVHFKEEIALGHTKFVHIGQANSKAQAINEINNCYKQMKDFQ